jgi:hypothetical protein
MVKPSSKRKHSMLDWLLEPEPRWFQRFTKRLAHKMTALDDQLAAIAAAQGDTATQLALVATDIGKLLSAIAAMPPGGLTPAQQVALNNIQASATSIDSGIAAINLQANPTVPPVAVPTLSSVSPSSGPAAGGTTVTLTGTGFTGATGVSFATVPATGINVVNGTTMTAITGLTPATGTGLPVIVTTPAGSNVTNTLWSYD